MAEENQTPDSETPDPELTEGTPEGEGEDHPKPPASNKGRKFSSDKPSMSEIIRRKRPNTRSCHILLDSSLNHEIQELQREISKLETKVKTTRTNSLADSSIRNLDRLREELDVKLDEAEEYTVEFKFQDIGRKKWDELIRENRPTDEEKKEYKDAGGEGVLQYSLADFPPKLINLSNIEPGISEEEAYTIFDEWSEGDLELLFNTALLVCKEPTSLPKLRADIAKMEDSEQSLTTAPSEESRTLSS